MVADAVVGVALDLVAALVAERGPGVEVAGPAGGDRAERGPAGVAVEGERVGERRRRRRLGRRQHRRRQPGGHRDRPFVGHDMTAESARCRGSAIGASIGTVGAVLGLEFDDGPRRGAGDRRRRRRAGGRRSRSIVKTIVSKVVVVGRPAGRARPSCGSSGARSSTAPTASRQTLLARRQPTTRRARSSAATSPWRRRSADQLDEHRGDRVGMRVGPEVAGALDRHDRAVGEHVVRGGRWTGGGAAAIAAAHRDRRHGDAGRVPRHVLARCRRARRSSPVPRPAAPARVRDGSRSQRSSPIIRRMNRSAASSGATPSCGGREPAVESGHQSSHDSGVS